jgi:hypothetical protein
MQDELCQYSTQYPTSIASSCGGFFCDGTFAQGPKYSAHNHYSIRADMWRDLPHVGSIMYHTIRSLINMQPCQLQKNQMLRRMSLIGLVCIPTLVDALNSTIIFLFERRFQQYIASLCSRFMSVGTYHYQPPLTNLRYLPKNSHATLPKNSQPTCYSTQKLTQKLTTHNGFVGDGTKKFCQHRECCRTLQ